jgi:2-phospho-L-lactate/phosphoenolpyruvate guanylyltransferase
MQAATFAIIPVKSLTAAKQRLAPVLPPQARRDLVLGMLQSVLGVVSQAMAARRILVVTPDPSVARLAEASGAQVLRERRTRGLNAAVRAGLAQACAAGASRALVLPADVPLITAGELATLLASVDEGAGARARLVPAADGGGTNAMLLMPPDAMAPSFGPGSYLRHLAQALARRLDVEVLHLPGLAGDIDHPRDLERLIGPAPQLAHFQFLAGHVMKAPRQSLTEADSR